MSKVTQLLCGSQSTPFTLSQTMWSLPEERAQGEQGCVPGLGASLSMGLEPCQMSEAASGHLLCGAPSRTFLLWLLSLESQGQSEEGAGTASENGLQPPGHGVFTGHQEGAEFQQVEGGTEEHASARLWAQPELRSRQCGGPRGGTNGWKGAAWRCTCICRWESHSRPSGKQGCMPVGS